MQSSIPFSSSHIIPPIQQPTWHSSQIHTPQTTPPKHLELSAVTEGGAKYVLSLQREPRFTPSSLLTNKGKFDITSLSHLQISYIWYSAPDARYNTLERLNDISATDLGNTYAQSKKPSPDVTLINPPPFQITSLSLATPSTTEISLP